MTPELNEATEGRWHLHVEEPNRLGSDAARRPSEFLDEPRLDSAVPAHTRANRCLPSPSHFLSGRTSIPSTRSLGPVAALERTGHMNRPLEEGGPKCPVVG